MSMLKLSKQNLQKIKRIREQGIQVRIIEGEPSPGWGGWIGIIFDDNGLNGAIGAYSRGYPYSNLGNLFNRIIQCYAFSSRGSKPRNTVYILRTNTKSTLWVKDILESLVQAY